MTGARALIAVGGATALFGLSGCATSSTGEVAASSWLTPVTVTVPVPSPATAVSPSAQPELATGTPAPKLPLTSFPPDPRADWLMGLQSHAQVDVLWRHSLQYTNAYGGNDGDAYYFIVAGADHETADEGWAAVTRRNAVVDDGHSTAFAVTESGHGALTIVSEALPLITLQAADGTTFSLNVRARTLTAAR